VTPLEIAANAFTALCIFLAGRNNVHTWWTGIVGCVLFGWLFLLSKLYADVTLQAFFVVTGIIGWWNWVKDASGEQLAVRYTGSMRVALYFSLGVVVTCGYALLLHRFTDAYAPLPDSAVLAFSVLGQLLLMGRRVESWWCWLLVNTIAIPLYLSRGLHLTAALYAAFWVNAIVSLRHWQRLASAQLAAPAPSPEGS
jgi:nicotinamide mononucleotide transporter